MQSIPLAVLKRREGLLYFFFMRNCMQSIPLAVLKRVKKIGMFISAQLHAIHTACGIETVRPRGLCCESRLIACNPYRLRC